MTDTINNAIPFVPEGTIDPAAGLNLSLNTIDALLQLLVVTVGANTPPTGVEGERHIVGTSPTGPWSGQANKLARYLDAAWQFFDARYAVNVADGKLWVRPGATWHAFGGAADAGWTAGTGTENKGAFATGSATLGDVAGRVLALENAARAFGVIV